MQKRYPHFMDRLSGDIYPDRIVGLTVPSVGGDPTCRDRVVREEPAGWYAAGAELVSGRPVGTFSARGVDTASLWSRVESVCKRPGVTWIVSQHAANVWAMLGFWDRVESGEVALSWEECNGTDERTVRDMLPGVQRRGSDNGSDSGRMPVRPVSDVRESKSGHPERKTGKGNGRRRAAGIAVTEDPPTILDARMGRAPGKLRLVDVRNFGVNLPTGHDQSEGGAREILDVMIQIIRIIKGNGWGSLSPTVGGQAMSTFRRRYLSHAIECHTNEHALRIEGDSYYGGRCECRRIGRVGQTVYHLDYRSLYPSVCVGANLPALLGSVSDRAGPPAKATEEAIMTTIADVQVLTDEPAYPCRREWGVIWPVGTWRTCLAGPELWDAIVHGRIVHWYAHATYSGSPCLSDFMADAYSVLEKERSAGNVPACNWLKRLLVCVPGKLGQRGSTWEFDHEHTAAYPWHQWVYAKPGGNPVRYRSLGWTCQREQKLGWSANAVPSIASWITSAGRMKLLSAIRSAEWPNVYYYDTDSVFVGADGMANLARDGLVGEGQLGMLRLIEKSDDMEILGIKHYRIGPRLVCAGLPFGGGVVQSQGGKVWIRDRLSSMVSRGKRPAAIRRLVDYSRVGRYRHGVVMDDSSVSPFGVDE